MIGLSFFVVDANAFYGVVQLEIQYGMQDDFSFTLAEVCFFPNSSATGRGSRYMNI